MSARILLLSAAVLAAAPVTAKSAVYLSLMGEPFWTDEAGKAPFDQWLEMADQDGDGMISKAEFRKDADAFFESLDTSGDHVIDGQEMAKYEQLAPGKTRAAGGAGRIPSSARPTPTPSSPVEDGMVAIVSAGNVPSATRIHPGGGPIDYTNLPQPVAMADRNIDGRVTADEFRKTADMRFANYDLNKDGKLSARELR